MIWRLFQLSKATPAASMISIRVQERRRMVNRCRPRSVAITDCLSYIKSKSYHQSQLPTTGRDKTGHSNKPWIKTGLPFPREFSHLRTFAACRTGSKRGCTFARMHDQADSTPAWADSVGMKPLVGYDHTDFNIWGLSFFLYY